MFSACAYSGCGAPPGPAWEKKNRNEIGAGSTFFFLEFETCFGPSPCGTRAKRVLYSQQNTSQITMCCRHFETREGFDKPSNPNFLINPSNPKCIMCDYSPGPLGSSGCSTQGLPRATGSPVRITGTPVIHQMRFLAPYLLQDSFTTAQTGVRQIAALNNISSIRVCSSDHVLHIPAKVDCTTEARGVR